MRRYRPGQIVRCCGRNDPAWGSREQRPPDLLLERFDLPGDGRLREMDILCRLGHRAASIGREKRPQVFEVSHKKNDDRYQKTKQGE